MSEVFTMGPKGMTRLSERPSLKRGTKLIYHYYAGNCNEGVLLDDATGKAAVIDLLYKWKSGDKDYIRDMFDNERGEYEYGADAYMHLDKYARHIKDQYGIGVYYTDEVLPEEDVKAAEELAEFIVSVRAAAKERAERERAERREQLRKEWGGILTENPKSDKEVNANIRKWLGIKFPGCKFKVAKDHSNCVHITGIDGPSLKELDKVCSIWQTGHSDPSGDYWDDTYSVFNNLYGGWSFVNVFREFTDETRNRLVSEIKSDFPNLVDSPDYKDWMIAENNLGLYSSIVGKYGFEFDACSVSRISVAWVVTQMKYYTPVMPEQPVKDFGRGGNKVAPVSAQGVKIVDYSEKAIAVIGDTKPIKDVLKKLGGSFNARLSCGTGWIFSKKKECEVREALEI